MSYKPLKQTPVVPVKLKLCITVACFQKSEPQGPVKMQHLAHFGQVTLKSSFYHFFKPNQCYYFVFKAKISQLTAFQPVFNRN